MSCITAIKKRLRDNLPKNPRNRRWGKPKRNIVKYQIRKNIVKEPYTYAERLPPEETSLRLDVEMVRCLKTGKHLAAWVAISHGMSGYRCNKGHIYGDSCIYQAKIQHRLEDVDLMTSFSGITEDMVTNGRPFGEVRRDVIYFLNRYQIIGANIGHDLESLNLQEYTSRCIDIQCNNGYYHGKRGSKDPIKLRTLSYSILNKKIKEFDERSYVRKKHNPVIDSRMTVRLYQKRLKGEAESDTDSDCGRSFEWTRNKVRNVEHFREIEEKERERNRKKHKKQRERRARQRREERFSRLSPKPTHLPNNFICASRSTRGAQHTQGI